ncbi:MAG: NAD-dependent epimerase, partial [Gammaproteobacteria bacterium]|nr:NAD-dependent epimerase [Gammaproteobacteria bacterium]
LTGRFAWIDGGEYLSSSCHVENACEGLSRALENGHGGEIYFVTDGPPRVWRELITRLLATQDVSIGDRNLPRALAITIATGGQWLWRLPGFSDAPPITRTALALTAHEVTVVDDKARSELGYQGAMTWEAGLAEMRAAA